MKKIIFLILMTVFFLQGEENFHRRHFLFCLNKNEAALQFNLQDKIASKVMKTDLDYSIAHLVKKHNIVNVQRWLPMADEKDVVGEVKLAHIYKATFSGRRSLEFINEVLNDFRDISGIHSAELQAINHVQGSFEPYIPNDSDYFKQWYVEQIEADNAWALWNGVPGDSTLLVGVVDTGVDYLHPDLEEAMWVNLGEDANGDGIIGPEDENGVDDDGNGFKDDFRGWDFAGESGNTADNDIRPPQAGTYNELSHGTHVAGVMAATTNNATGIAGISFRSKIIATKHSADDDLTEPSIYNGYAGIEYCMKMGAKVINCSWGGGYDYYGKIVVQNAVQNYGALVICAAGNDGNKNDTPTHYPSDFEDAIGIAATNRNDEKAYYSNYGKVIDFSAPGGEGGSYTNAIYSTIHDNAGSYAAWQGTSMASPVAAGAAALVMAFFPDSSNTWVANTLKTTADNIDAVNPAYSGMLGSGRINVFNAISKQLYPNLSVAGLSYEVLNAHTNELKPGSVIAVSIMLENRQGWVNARDVYLTIRNTSPYLTIVDSTATYGLIENGNILSNGQDSMIIKIAENAPFSPVKLNLAISANGDQENPYITEDQIEILITNYQNGFPFAAEQISQPLAVADLTGDDKKEIIFVGEDNQLYVVDHKGNSLPSFPRSLGDYTTMPPAVGDINADGKLDIAVATRSGHVQIFENDGNLLYQMDVAEPVYGHITLSNVDDEDDLELIFGTMRRNLHVLKIDSTELEGFPKAFNLPIDQGVAVADINGDQQSEMIFGTFNGQLFAIDAAGDTLSNFPLQLDMRLSVTPIVVETDTSLYIIAATNDQKILKINPQGTVKSLYQFNHPIVGSPAVQDLNGDGNPEIIVADESGM
ncbi:MAG: S8 family serine peptidase, partial [Caldithrix sp.]|nr:S8 family serine peptidase [Caldithrix sp.]